MSPMRHDDLREIQWPSPPGPEESELLAMIDPARLPEHIAIIMDGNGRWAESRSLPRLDGHRAGADAVREAVETSARLGIRFLTLYAFSVENWKRPLSEVTGLMTLLRVYIREELPALKRNRIRFSAMGRVSELDVITRRVLERTERVTAHHDGMRLNVALNYGGRAEIVDAARAIAREVAEGKLEPERVDEACVSRHLYSPDIPDPDLLVRTSGECRVSNFLLWQIAYSEFVILPVLWPDFKRVHLFDAILEFQRRDRRFGGVSG